MHIHTTHRYKSTSAARERSINVVVFNHFNFFLKSRQGFYNKLWIILSLILLLLTNGIIENVKPNDNIAQSEAGDQNKLSSPTNRQVDAETAKKIEEVTGQITPSASSSPYSKHFSSNSLRLNSSGAKRFSSSERRTSKVGILQQNQKYLHNFAQWLDVLGLVLGQNWSFSFNFEQ